MPNVYAVSLQNLDLGKLDEVGGKNASLGEMIQHLTARGVRVPGGFAVTAAAFRLHLSQGGLEDEVYEALDRLDIADVTALAETGRRIRHRIRDTQLPEEVVRDIRDAYARLSSEYAEEATDVAVRSSATAEDLPTASFAGQQDTYLNVHGDEALLRRWSEATPARPA
jgi:pyruvate,water dikinase